MKTMYHPVYHYNGFVATRALGHMKYGYTLLVPMNQGYHFLYQGFPNSAKGWGEILHHWGQQIRNFSGGEFFHGVVGT